MRLFRKFIIGAVCRTVSRCLRARFNGAIQCALVNCAYVCAFNAHCGKSFTDDLLDPVAVLLFNIALERQFDSFGSIRTIISLDSIVPATPVVIIFIIIAVAFAKAKASFRFLFG